MPGPALGADGALQLDGHVKVVSPVTLRPARQWRRHSEAETTRAGLAPAELCSNIRNRPNLIRARRRLVLGTAPTTNL